MQEIKKRLRIFAGPNGSGKTTLFEEISKKYRTGHFVNADYIENTLDSKGILDLDEFKINVDQDEFIAFCKTKNAASLIQKSIDKGHIINLCIKENFFVDASKESHSYEGSLIAAFIRGKLIQVNQSFCFETVMSHVSKLEDILSAKRNGYKTYLYFVCIDDPEINISRIKNRVAKGGHDVENEDVIGRYSKTLNHLFPAIELCDNAYLFDNSGEEGNLLIAEITNGSNGSSLKLNVDEPIFPNWFKEYVLPKFL